MIIQPKTQSQWPREKPVRLAPFFIIVCQWSCPVLQKNGGLLVYLLKWWCCAMQSVNVVHQRVATIGAWSSQLSSFQKSIYVYIILWIYNPINQCPWIYIYIVYIYNYIHNSMNFES